MEVVTRFIILIPFLIFAVILSKGKGAFLIAGYNAKPESEKAKYDEPALCKFMGKTMYGICFSILILALSDWLESQTLMIIGIVLIIGVIVFSLIYMNTGNRFKKS